MKCRNHSDSPCMEITLPNGMKIIARLSGNADPNRPEADWAGINVVMMTPTGNRLPLCSAEYVERDRKVRVFGHNGRINELDVSFEAPQTQWNRFNEAPVTGSLRLKMA